MKPFSCMACCSKQCFLEVETVRHQCRSVSRTLRHWYRTVSTSSKHFCYNRPYRSKV